MIISLNALTLADSALSEVSALSISGQLIVQEAQFFRAAQAGFFGRGNRSQRVTFEVIHTFHTVTEAEAYALTHANSLPDTGDLVFTTGQLHESNRSVCEMKDAVLETMQATTHNNTLRYTYTFVGAQITATGTVDPVDGGGYDGGEYTGNPVQGSLDGGGYADALTPASLNLNGGTYVV